MASSGTKHEKDFRGGNLNDPIYVLLLVNAP